MTKEEKSKICEILGYSKAIQLTKLDAEQSQKMLEEIDKRLIELISAKEEQIVEKKVIEEHHYYNHNNYPWWQGSSWTYTTGSSITGTSSSSTTIDSDYVTLTI